MDFGSIRARQEQYEENNLSKYACKPSMSKGRERHLESCDVRTDFQRDRDRIIHCKSFRRLKYKTQVFLSPEGDHYRTRLTHTLEVAQIARTIARALRLNEDLTEAIALGHDLGHTPFGHVGESVLNSLLEGGFEHNKESIRIVEKLENGVGLNLTFEVRDGILHHKNDGTPSTLEGKVVSYSDRIAYINHDIDDGIRANVLTQNDLPRDCIEILGNSHGTRINNMVKNVILTSMDQNFIALSPTFEKAMMALREFMFEKVYTDPVAKSEEGKAKNVVNSLFHYYLNNHNQLGNEFLKYIDTDGVEVVIADYIACMTDRYAIKTFEKLYIPKSWNV